MMIFSVVTQMWFFGKTTPRELSTNTCIYKKLLVLLWVTHSVISVKLSTRRNVTGLRTRSENFCVMPVTCVKHNLCITYSASFKLIYSFDSKIPSHGKSRIFQVKSSAVE